MHDPEDRVQLRLVSGPQEMLQHDARSGSTVPGLDQREVRHEQELHRQVPAMPSGDGQVR